MKEVSLYSSSVSKNKGRIPLATLNILQENYVQKTTAAILPEKQAYNCN